MDQHFFFSAEESVELLHVISESWMKHSCFLLERRDEMQMSNCCQLPPLISSSSYVASLGLQGAIEDRAGLCTLAIVSLGGA